MIFAKLKQVFKKRHRQTNKIQQKTIRNSKNFTIRFKKSLIGGENNYKTTATLLSVKMTSNLTSLLSENAN